MNLAVINSITNSNRKKAIVISIANFSLALFFLITMLVLFVSYLILSSHLIGLSERINQVKIELKNLSNQNAELEIYFAKSSLEIPSEVNFEQLGLIKNKDISYLEKKPTDLVRVSSQ